MELAEFANRVAGLDGGLATLIARALASSTDVADDDVDQANELAMRLVGEVFFDGDRGLVDRFVVTTSEFALPERPRLHAV